MKFKAIHLIFAIALLIFLSACAGEVNGMPEPHPASAQSIEAGRQLMIKYGCGSCHTIPGIPGANAEVGPPLDHFYDRASIAGQLPNTDENLIKWIQNPQQVIPDDAMPNMGVTAEEAKYIAAYLYHEPSVFELIAH